MEKFSVKKPFTILVLVIMIITLGVVSVTRLTTDLLPEMSLPYLMVITTYPGASPEKVENAIGIPMERSLGTISGVKNVMTANSENYCMTQLEFEDGTDMDSALVKVSGAVDEISQKLPPEAGTPSILEISMDMMATMYVAVSRDGYDVYELSDFVRDEAAPYLERQSGVARVTTIGSIEKTIQVELNQEKIDAINDRILAKTNTALDDARKQLDDADAQVQRGQEALEAQEKVFGEMVSSSIFDRLSGSAASASASLKSQMESLTDVLYQVQDAVNQMKPSVESSLEDASQQLRDAQNGLGEAQAYLRQAEQAAENLSEQADNAEKAVDEAADRLNEAVDRAEELQKSAEEAAAAAEDAAKKVQSDVQAAADDPQKAAQEAAQTVQEDIQEALDPQKAQEAYNQAQQAIGEIAANRQNAQHILAEAQQRLAEAQAAYDQAKARYEEVSKQASDALSEEQIEKLKLQIQSVISSVSKAADKSADTFGDLMLQVTAISEAIPQVDALIGAVEEADPAGTLSSKISDLKGGVDMVNSGIDQIPALLDMLESGFGALTQGQLDAAVGFSTATIQLANAQQQLSSARAQYEASREAALDNANVDQLVTAETLSQLIYAQNFSMPAGYIDDKNDHSWLLKVGEQFEDAEEIKDALLVDLDATGTIRLFDVADVTVIDNAGDSYAKLNGTNAICLCVYKASTAGTNAVSKATKAALEELKSNNEGLRVVPLMDQGVYIDLIVESILSSILLGSLLAVIVLILFLKDVRPTLVVGISIPLSVLFTIVLMYFSGLSLNMMTLSGLALGIGMLVDNSIVVMENIFRLRGMGIPAPRAAVQGARQVRGAIVASTLTTVCVFLPMVFTTGTVRELLIPMALSIGYCLMASLVVALTVVPASASTFLRNVKPKKQPLFSKITAVYGKTLSWCLRFKIVPLAVAVLLLVMTVWQVIRTGIVLLPEMASSDIEVDITTDASMNRETSYQKMDEVIDTLLEIDGVEYIGALDMASSVALISDMAGDSSEYGSYMCYVIADQQADPDRLREITETLEETGKKIDGCNVTVSTGDMSDMTALAGSDDLTINVYGKDLERLEEITSDVCDMVSEIPGFTGVTDSTANGDKTLQLNIDRDKAMEYGLTTAQIYTAIASRMTTSVNSTSITVDGMEINITIIDETDPLTRENLLDMEFEEADLTSMAQGGTGAASASGGMTSGMSSAGTGAASAGVDMSALSGMLSGSDESDGSEDDESDADNSSSDSKKKIHKLSEFATIEETDSLAQINRENQSRYLTVTANAAKGENAALLTRSLTGKLNDYQNSLEHGYRVEIAGQSETISDMIRQMAKLLGLGVLFIYLVMVAQFQSLLSPFIVLFTVPLAFTGGMLGLMITRQPLSMLSLMGFLILVGTVVNNGIVFVDYANQLRIGGMKRRDALVATGQTRMRPIIMTALTTILAMGKLMLGKDMGSQLGSGMAVVITGGLLYATLMTLYMIPVLYDIFFRRNPMQVDTGDDLEEELDDAAHFLSQLEKDGSSD